MCDWVPVGENSKVPRIYTPLQRLSVEPEKALNVFNANALRAAVIRDLALHPEGGTTGEIGKRIGVDYRQVHTHIKTLIREGLAVTDIDGEVRSGQRVRYTLDLAELQKQGDAYMRFLEGK